MSMRQFRRALRSANGKALAYQLRDGYGAALAPMFERIGRGERVSDAEIAEAMGAEHKAGEVEREPERIRLAAGPVIIPGGGKGKATALISARGVAMYDLEYQPYCFSTLLLAQTMTALANDPEIGAIAIDIDSPGGVVTGTPEAADAVFAAREAKKVVALINPLCASAAYWIASQAGEIVAVPSADIGSIGVFWLHVECSKMLEMDGIKPTFVFAGENKVKGNSFEPLPDDERAFQQSQVDAIYAQFLKSVARGRGVNVADVEKNFGQGRTFMPSMAKRVGMIDRIATLDVALARYGVQPGTDMRRRNRGEAAKQEQPVPNAAEEQPTAAEADAAPAPAPVVPAIAADGTAVAAAAAEVAQRNAASRTALDYVAEALEKAWERSRISAEATHRARQRRLAIKRRA